MNKLFPFLFALGACGGSEKAASDMVTSAMMDETTKVEYRYGDASVAPDFHRSYNISITENEKSITIDCYGDVLLTKQYSNTQAEFLAFRGELSKKGIKKHKEKYSNGCSGGTTEAIRLYKNNATLFDAYVYHCSGDNGTLFLPDGTADLIRSQIPESVESLIDSTLQNN